MRPPRQTTLAVDPPFIQRLENFVAGDNLEVIAGVRAAIKSEHFAGLWVCGTSHVGKSHLLRAACVLDEGKAMNAAFVACQRNHTAAPGLAYQLDLASQFGSMVVLDDVGVLAGDREFEYQLMAMYQRLVQEGGALLVSHGAPATAVEFNLPDLNSRMRSLLHYQLNPLQDDDKADLLRTRAAHRGYQLDEAVLAYWLARGPRDIEALLIDLDRLDRASLSRKRSVTIPLLKDELGY